MAVALVRNIIGYSSSRSTPKYYFSRMAEISKIIRKQQSKLVDTLARKSHFKQDEVEGLLALYRKLSEGAEVDRLDRTRFRNCG